MHAQRPKFFLIAIQDFLRQAELGDAVTKHAADFILPFKDGDVVALPREAHRHGQSRGAAADDGDLLPFVRLPRHHETVEIGVGNVMLDARNLYRAARLLPQHAVALALPFMVADQRAKDAHRVVVEKKRPRLVQIPFEEKLDHFRNVCLQRAAILTAGRFVALLATPRLADNMDRHQLSPHREHCSLFRSIKSVPYLFPFFHKKPRVGEIPARGSFVIVPSAPRRRNRGTAGAVCSDGISARDGTGSRQTTDDP